MRIEFREIDVGNYIHRMKDAVLGRQLIHPAPKDDSPVTKNEFSQFLQTLEEALKTIGRDLQELERELGRKKNAP